MAQSLTGVWRGSFIQSDFDILKGKPTEDKYKYEIQINNLPNNAIEGVTYSYKTTVFYGKASMQGIFTKGTKNLIIKEIKMLELKINDNTQPCLMTCYLDYSKTGSKEFLIGTYTSINEKKANCGSGTVYLEKVLTTEFEKEPFLLKKVEPIIKNKLADNKTNSTLDSPKRIVPSTKKQTLQKPIGTTNQPQFKPGAEGFIITKETKKLAFKKPEIIDTIKPLTKAPEKKTEAILPVPKVLLERENNLQKTLIIDQEDVQIDFYDNGQVDNDSITVYHNNEILISKGRLDIRPLTLHIHLNKNNPFYELITVAENLGDIPPNTALMVVTAGKKRYEVTITSDDKKNAKVVLEYKPTEKNK
ncbi:MAG: hypothetical protein H7068_00615 [Pedobacter sp.]|nr:hypothetical protein [Chitinophagaceae bacterium]